MSGPPETPQSPSSDDERRQREETLRALARDAQSESAGAPPREIRPTAVATRARTQLAQLARGGGGRRQMVIAGLLVALLLASGGYYLTHRLSASNSTPSIPTALNLDLTARFSCMSNFSWSPDSRYIAFIGLPSGYVVCNSDTKGFVIAIFNARTGKLYKAMDLVHTGQPFSGGGLGGQFDWTPDSTSVVLQGVVGTGPPKPGQTSFTDALLILPIDGSAPRMLRGRTWQIGSEPPHGYVAWDVKSGMERIVPGDWQLPLALTYSWTSDGRLAPARPMPTFTSPTAYTGSPVQRKGTVWRWQAGTITPSLSFDDVGGKESRPPFGVTYDSSASFWSPDGRYYIPHMNFQTLLPTLPGAHRTPAGQACAKREITTLLCDAKTQPAAFADAAFAALDRVAEAGLPPGQGGVTPYPPVQVAWRPDGKYLATMLPDQPDAAKGSNYYKSTVALYRTETGALATKLTFERYGGFGFGGGLYNVFWSPDGKQLAYFGQSPVLRIWGAASLPS